MNGWPAFADVDRLVAVMLATAALVAMLRIAWRQVRAPQALRSHPPRIAALLIAQPLAALLLYIALFPPQDGNSADTLVVATAGTTPQAWSAAPGGVRVALPEAPALAQSERVPDLATALRRHPGVRRVRVVGTGLEARDRDAGASRALAFDPAPLPRGVVELHVSPVIVAGTAFDVAGRVHDAAGGSVELLDPSGRRIDRAVLAADGRFALAGSTRAAGGATFQLRLRAARLGHVESVGLPVQVEAAQSPRLLVLAGAPGPEVKFLRRWAEDAGLPVHAQIDVGGGMQLGDAPLRIDAGTLARFDAVVLDERAWSAMSDGARVALTEAVRGGLGMILRITSAPGDVERRRLRALGFTVDAGSESEPVRLRPPPRDEQSVRARLGPGTRDAPRMQEAPLPDVPMLTRRALRTVAPDAVVLDSPAAGVAPAMWRAEGRGRIALWTLTDSYALALAGRDDLHNAVWSDGIATIARPRGQRRFAIDGELRQAERIALCGIAVDASVATPAGAALPLRIDPASGPRACAAFWPQQAGWHLLRSGDRTQAFHVRAANEAPGLHAFAVREATTQLRDVVDGTDERTSGMTHGPGLRWLAWLAFLLVVTASWWLERSRLGRRAQG